MLEGDMRRQQPNQSFNQVDPGRQNMFSGNSDEDSGGVGNVHRERGEREREREIEWDKNKVGKGECGILKFSVGSKLKSWNCYDWLSVWLIYPSIN